MELLGLGMQVFLLTCQPLCSLTQTLHVLQWTKHTGNLVYGGKPLPHPTPKSSHAKPCNCLWEGLKGLIEKLGLGPGFIDVYKCILLDYILMILAYYTHTKKKKNQEKFTTNVIFFKPWFKNAHFMKQIQSKLKHHFPLLHKNTFKWEDAVWCVQNITSLP